MGQWWSMLSICRCFPSTKIFRGLSSKSEIVTPLQCSMHSWRWSLRTGCDRFHGLQSDDKNCNHVCVLCVLYIIIYNQYMYIYIICSLIIYVCMYVNKYIYICWLVVSTPLKHSGQLGWWHYQYMESHKIHVPNHQPVCHLYTIWLHYPLVI